MAPERTRIDDLIDQLRVHGLRSTIARRAVLTELVDAGDTHLPADELARRINADHPAIHLSTIYRTLDSLTEAKVITVARFGDQPVTYHLAGDVHHHAVCTGCGRSTSLSPDVFSSVLVRLRRDYDFDADPHHLTITGTCGSCRASPR